jgi:hypothetical protein
MTDGSLALNGGEFSKKRLKPIELQIKKDMAELKKGK